MRKMGVSDYDISSTLSNISITKISKKDYVQTVAKEREFTEEEKEIMTKIAEKYGETNMTFTGLNNI